MSIYENLILRKARVVSIDDPDKKGKVQVKILPDLKDIKDNLLPWAMPFSSHNSSKVMENDLPELNSQIRVLIREDWQRVYYLNNTYYYGLFDFKKITDQLDTIDTINNKDYKNIKFRLYEDGGLEFHNTNSGEHGFIHKNGSTYFFIDKDGKIIIEGSEININGKTKQLVTWSELNQALSTFLNQLTLAMTTTPIIGNGSPQASWIGLPTYIDISSAKTTTIKTDG
jgi:hypothetical protein